MNPLLFSAIPELIGLVKKSVSDKDKAAEIAARIEALALATPTHPFIDGLHKLSRTIQAVTIVTAITALKLKGVNLNPAELAALVGLSAGYSLLKGKGL